MIIYFVRHASAGSPKKLNPKKDEKRPLDSDGVHQCTQMGRVLASMDVTVDAVISSPLKRATQTASLVANELGYEGKLIIENALRPESKYDQFRDMLRKHPRADAVMVVGHNPNFSEFLGQIIADNGSQAFVDMKKGSVAKVEREQKKFVLHWLITPRVTKACVDAGSSPGALPEPDLSGNGELLIPAELTRNAGKEKKLKKQPQAEALTIKSRPKTSRK